MENILPACSSSYYLWRNGDFASINMYIANVDWFDILCRFPAACDMWRAFVNVIYDAVNQFVPIKQRIPRHKKQLKPKYPKEIRKAFAVKRRCGRKYRVKMNYVTKNEYKYCIKLCNELTRNCEKECEQHVLDANNVGAFYRFANKSLNNKTGVGPLYNAHDDEVVVIIINNNNTKFI